MIPYKFKGEKCVVFSIVYYTVLYSPLKVCSIFLCMAIKHTLRDHKHDPQRHTITHPSKVVNNVTIEINNKSMTTHINSLRLLYNNLQFSFKSLTILSSLIVSSANFLSKVGVSFKLAIS